MDNRFGTGSLDSNSGLGAKDPAPNSLGVLMTTASSPQTRPIEQHELLQDILPQYLHKQHLTILTGPPYVGKSRFLEWLAYCASMGLPCFWGQLPPLKVLFCTERTRQLIMTHMTGLNLELPDEDHLQFFTLGDMTPEQRNTYNSNRTGMVKRLADKLKPDIIILDTLINFLAPMNSKATNDYSAMADSFMNLQVWTYALGAATIGVHHVGKEREGQVYANVLDKTLGSTAIIGNTTSAWNLSKAFEDPTTDTVYLRLQAKTHACSPPPDIHFKVERDEPLSVCSVADIPVKIDMMPLINAVPAPLQDSVLDHIQENGTEFLRTDVVDAVKKKTESDPHNIQQAISRLVEKGKLLERKEPFPGRKRWLKRPTTVN